IELLRHTIGPQIAIKTVIAPDLWPALVDPNQMEHVLLNLALNARDAMPEGGEITIALENSGADNVAKPHDLACGDHVVLSVADTGTGMSEEVLARAVDPFFTTKEVGKGTGLGLSQVYGIAKQSGGTVRLSSSPSGARVEVFLPRGDVVPRRASAGALEIEPETPLPAPGKTILVVDDDAGVRKLAASGLADRGYRVVEAETGSIALSLLDKHADIALLLIDFAMPMMNGVEAASRARALRPDLPILYMTGYADTQLLRSAADAGSILEKPFRISSLVAKIEDVLGETQDAT
ncbi:MAG TPA: ATP-binding protein, partial [Stellaceae bacterium]|nr:ATP-binding protein [Stellaceae bacterium]